MFFPEEPNIEASLLPISGPGQGPFLPHTQGGVVEGPPMIREVNQRPQKWNLLQSLEDLLIWMNRSWEDILRRYPHHTDLIC